MSAAGSSGAVTAAPTRFDPPARQLRSAHTSTCSPRCHSSRARTQTRSLSFASITMNADLGFPPSVYGLAAGVFSLGAPPLAAAGRRAFSSLSIAARSSACTSSKSVMQGCACNPPPGITFSPQHIHYIDTPRLRPGPGPLQHRAAAPGRPRLARNHLRRLGDLRRRVCVCALSGGLRRAAAAAGTLRGGGRCRGVYW